jgi:hypothetical protein
VGGTSGNGSSHGGSGGNDAGVDQASSGTGGVGGDQPDGGPDVPQGGSGGTSSGSSGGASSSGGATGGTGGTSGGSGGTSKPGGSTAGSSSGSGGGGATSSDGGSDANPLLEGLVLYYRFESANGTVLPDDSGNRHDGTLSSGPAADGGVAPSGTPYEFVTGKVGKALALHKAGLGYVRLPPAVFANASELTIAAWVNVTTDQSWQRILDLGVTPNPYQYTNSATGTKYLNIVPKGNGSSSSNMLFSISTNGYNNEQSLSAPSLSANTWTHITVVLASGGGARLYVNGAEAAYSASVTLRPSNLGAIDYAFIGKSRFDADPAFDGLIDSFRVYNRALSATEVQALYNYTAGH